MDDGGFQIGLLQFGGFGALKLLRAAELDDRWKICSKIMKRLAIEPESYDYDRESIGRVWLILQTFLPSVSMPAGLTSLW